MPPEATQLIIPLELVHWPATGNGLTTTRNRWRLIEIQDIMNEKIEYTPVRMVVRKIEPRRAILSASTTVQGAIENYTFQEEDDC